MHYQANKAKVYTSNSARNHLGECTPSAKNQLSLLFDKQKGLCALTGLPLVLGSGDCSIDHILPKSKYPELKHDINNLRFVHLWANIAKRNLTDDEFVAMCRLVVEHADKYNQ